MPEACSQGYSSSEPGKAPAWGGQGRSGLLVSTAGWACLTPGPFLILPSVLHGRRCALQAVLPRVLGQWAAGLVLPTGGFGKRLEGGWGWEEAWYFFPSFSGLNVISGNCHIFPMTLTPAVAPVSSQ